MVPFESLGAVSYSHSIVTMAVSCIVSEIYSEILVDFSYNPLHLTPPLGDLRRNITITFGTE